MNATKLTLETIESEFKNAETQWIGCDWKTDFGVRKLNLKHLNSKRTRLLANATSGEESSNWHDATLWLARIEADAAKSQVLATRAVAACRKSDWVLAMKLIETACAIESVHHARLIWQPLHDSIGQAIL